MLLSSHSSFSFILKPLKSESSFEIDIWKMILSRHNKLSINLFIVFWLFFFRYLWELGITISRFCSEEANFNEINLGIEGSGDLFCFSSLQLQKGRFIIFGQNNSWILICKFAFGLNLDETRSDWSYIQKRVSLIL